MEKGIEKGMEKGIEKGMEKGKEIGADIEYRAAAEAIADMVRGFMADLGISSEEAIRRARVPERYSDSVRAILSEPS